MNGKLPKEGRGFVYKLYNLKLDVYYIGQTTQRLNRRFSCHKTRSKTANSLLYRTMRDSNINDWYIAVVSEESLENLSEAEQELIRMYVAHTNCLNEYLRLNEFLDYYIEGKTRPFEISSKDFHDNLSAYCLKNDRPIPTYRRLGLLVKLELKDRAVITPRKNHRSRAMITIL